MRKIDMTQLEKMIRLVSEGIGKITSPEGNITVYKVKNILRIDIKED